MHAEDGRMRSFLDTFKSELLSIEAHDECKKYAVDRQYKRAGKKARIDNPLCDKVAIGDFLCNNQRAKDTVLNLSPEIVSEARLFIENALWNFSSDNGAGIQVSLSLGLLLSLWKFGPGASNGVTGTHFCEKIKQSMTCTEAAEPYVRLLRRMTYRLSRYDTTNGYNVSLIKGSRLATVPKNEETSRTIAIEPSGNMALQLAAGIYLEGALKKVGLFISSPACSDSLSQENLLSLKKTGRPLERKLTQQELNYNLARLGSLDGSLATIDLKAASDMITPSLVRELLPKEWFYFLSKIRSEYIELPDGTDRKLHMMSTMGNGFTFPLMTLIILSLIYADGRVNHNTPNMRIDYSRIGVFGDDIVVPTERFESTCEVLRCAGLIINDDKSYNVGFFRESCGGDFYRGYNVTPIYVKSLSEDAEVYVAINQLLLWCAKHNVLLLKTLQFLIDLLTTEPLFVASWDQNYSGIKYSTRLLKRRYRCLKILPYRRKFKGDSDLLYLCAIGGFLEPGEEPSYTPRVSKPRYKLANTKCPKGYLDGRDWVFLSRDETKRIDIFLDLVTY